MQSNDCRGHQVYELADRLVIAPSSVVYQSFFETLAWAIDKRTIKYDDAQSLPANVTILQHKIERAYPQLCRS